MKKFWKEFKTFISKGNVIDLAVAVIIGAAFGKIVTSLVDDIIMPLITSIIGKNSIADLYFTIGTTQIMYGNFLQSILDFLIIAFFVFLMIKIVVKTQKAVKEAGSTALWHAKRPKKARLSKKVYVKKHLPQTAIRFTNTKKEVVIEKPSSDELLASILKELQTQNKSQNKKQAK